jgi:hypothetical protein
MAKFFRGVGVNSPGGLMSLRATDVPGVSNGFGQDEAGFGWTTWMHLQPLNTSGFKSALRQRLQPFLSQMQNGSGFEYSHDRGNGFVKNRDAFVLEGMDEPRTFTVEQLLNLTGGVVSFRRYLAAVKPAINPQSLPSGSLRNAMPINITHVTPGNLSAAVLYVHSCWWRQLTTQDMWKAWSQTAHEIFGSGVRTAMDPTTMGFVAGLDFYGLSRRGILDTLLPESTNGDWVPPAFHAFLGDIIR